MTPNTKSQIEQISYWPSRGTRVSSGLILSLLYTLRPSRRIISLSLIAGTTQAIKNIFSYYCMESNNLCLTNAVLSVKQPFLALKIQRWETPLLCWANYKLPAWPIHSMEEFLGHNCFPMHNPYDIGGSRLLTIGGSLSVGDMTFDRSFMFKPAWANVDD